MRVNVGVMKKKTKRKQRKKGIMEKYFKFPDDF